MSLESSAQCPRQADSRGLACSCKRWRFRSAGRTQPLPKCLERLSWLPLIEVCGEPAAKLQCDRRATVGAMQPPRAVDLTALLKAWSRGDQTALERLTPLVYDELRRLARRHIRWERAGQTLQPTALVNEAYT